MSKVRNHHTRYRIFCLSDRLSRRLHALAGDSQLWKAAYYDRFVRPRATRIPRIREQDKLAFSYSSRFSKWLDDERLVRRGRETNWKRQYKLRHNWSRGSCHVSQVEIVREPTVPSPLVRLHADIVITADPTNGLQAFAMEGEQYLVATLELKGDDADGERSPTPISLAIDDTSDGDGTTKIAIGFSNGVFGIYMLQEQERSFRRMYLHEPSTNGGISSIAYATPYLVTMTETQRLSLYCFPTLHTDNDIIPTGHNIASPQLLLSLKSQTTWPPLSLSVRISSSIILTSIAYAVPTYLSGWSVGLQELRVALDGQIIQSRLTTAMNQGFSPSFSSPARSRSSRPGTPSRDGESGDFTPISSLTEPTSLSYSHPYLLVSHPDNTLTLYMVSSTETELTIGPGNRLWGHTSSVTGAQVGDRGKAVSVSSHGGEIRIWELEGGISSKSSKRRVAAYQTSVQVRPERTVVHRTDAERMDSDRNEDTVSLRPGLTDMAPQIGRMKGWLGFDEEKVVVLSEEEQGAQALVVYDFS